MTSFNRFFSLISIITIYTSACKSETDDEWNLRINQKIEKLRKKDAKIELDRTAFGKNARLHVNQTKMSFPMGTAVKAKFVAECADGLTLMDS